MEKQRYFYLLALISFLLHIGESHAACTSPAGVAGEIEFFTSVERYKFCDGTKWQPIASNTTATACSNDKAINYNPLSDDKLAYCKNSTWHTMNCTVTTTACTQAGEIDYNTTTDMFQYCNGSFWVDMSNKIAGGGGSSGPYWLVTVGIDDKDQGYVVEEMSDGGFVLLSEAGDSSNRYGQLIKLTSSGALDWSYTFDPDAGNDEIPADMIVTSTDDIVVVGHSDHLGTTAGNNGFIIKFNSSGTLQWTRSFGGADTSDPDDEDRATTVVEDTDGGYIVGGWTRELSTTEDPLYLKYDTSGALVTNSYSIQVNGSGDREQYTKIVPLRSGGFLASGQNKFDEALIAKLNSAGLPTQAVSYKANGVNTANFYNAIEAENGDIIAVGNSDATICGGGNDDAYIIRMQSDLTTTVWARCLGGSGKEKLFDVVEVPCTGDIIAVGMTESASLANGGNDGWMIKLDSSGTELWTKTIDHPGGTAGDDDDDEALHDVLISSDGSLVIVGHVSNHASGDAEDRLIVGKLDLNGTVGGTACTRISADKGISASSTSHTVSSETIGVGGYGDYGADNHNSTSESISPVDTSGTIGLTSLCTSP